MPRRLVADSNVLISALHRRGKPQAILDLARAGDVDLYLSPFILDEVAGILSRKLGWDDERVSLALLGLRVARRLSSGASDRECRSLVSPLMAIGDRPRESLLSRPDPIGALLQRLRGRGGGESDQPAGIVSLSTAADSRPRLNQESPMCTSSSARSPCPIGSCPAATSPRAPGAIGPDSRARLRGRPAARNALFVQ